MRRTAYRWGWAVGLACALGAAGCEPDVAAGMQSANDLLYRQKYVDAERLYRKLLRRLDAGRDTSEAAEAQRLQLLDRLGKINALYLRDYSQAIADYETLIRRFPRAEPTLAALATVADLYHYKLGNLQQAIAAYQRLVTEFAQRPEARHAQLETVAAYFKLKNYSQARLEAEALIKTWPDAPEAAQAQFEMADAYYVQKRYTEAIATYERLLATRPDGNLTALVLFELGNCYQELGDGAQALTYYYGCLGAHPNPGLVQRKIARVRSRLHHTAPAATILNAQVTPAQLPTKPARVPRPLPKVLGPPAAEERPEVPATPPPSPPTESHEDGAPSP